MEKTTAEVNSLSPPEDKVPVLMRDILVALGFTATDRFITDTQPSYWFDFGNLKLAASQVTNFYFCPVFFFGGVGRGVSSLHDIQFDKPLEVESFKQGVAWICYGIGDWWWWQGVSTAQGSILVSTGRGVAKRAAVGAPYAQIQE